MDGYPFSLYQNDKINIKISDENNDLFTAAKITE